MPSAPPRARRPALALAAVIGGSAIVVTFAAVLAFAVPQTFGTRPATCLSGVAGTSIDNLSTARCFCEAVGAGLLKQPANALSSLAFAVAGIAAYLARRRLPPTSRERALAPILAAVLVALSAGSLAYHGALTFAGQLLDVQGMYLLGILLVAGSLWRASKLTAPQAALASAITLAVLIAAQAIAPDSRRWLFAVVLIPGIVLEARLAPPSRPLRLAIASLLVAYAAWLADDRGWLCDPTSWLQGHALWHLLTAVSGGLLVSHYRVTASASPGEDHGARRLADAHQAPDVADACGG